MANVAIMAGLAALSAAASAAAAKKGMDAQAEATARTERAAQNEIANRQEDANAQAAEQMSDRMREAARQLSMARVLASEGAGNLNPMATNINAGASEDLSRLDASRRSTQSSLQSQKEAARVDAANTYTALAAQGSGLKYQFFSQVVSGAAQGYAAGKARTTQKATAEGKRA